MHCPSFFTLAGAHSHRLLFRRYPWPLVVLDTTKIYRANELRRRGSSSEGPPAASSGAPPSSASAPAAAAAATTTAAAAAGRSASADRADSDPSSRPPRVSLRRAQGADGVTVHQLVIEGDGEGGESRSGGGRARDREQSEMPGRMMLMNLMQMLHGGSGGLPGGLAGLFMAMGKSDGLICCGSSRAR